MFPFSPRTAPRGPRHGPGTRVLRGVLAAVAILTLAAGDALAQPYFARTQVLTAPNPENAFTESVAVDGDWMAAGAPVHGAGTPRAPAAVYVYRQTAGTWAPFQEISCPASNQTLCRYFGNSVALSGTTLAVSSATASGNTVPTPVWIYRWSGASWEYETELTGPPGWNVGDVLALDGDYLVTSGVSGSASSWTRTAFVFERSGTTWSRTELVGIDRSPSDHFALALDVSGDTICVGAPALHSRTIPGATHVFRRTGGTWAQDGPKLQPLPTGGARVGIACAVSGDTVVVGVPYVFRADLPGSGRIFAYTRLGSAWSLAQTIWPDNNGTYELGDALAIDGDTLVAGAPESSAGMLYARVGGVWVLRERAEAPVESGSFGDAVATDGHTLLVTGRRFFSDDIGSIAIYRPTSTPPPAPGPPPAPTSFQATVAGNVVSLAWAPGIGAAATSYTVLARAMAGGPIVASLPVGGQTSFSVAAPNGTFVVSVLASNAHGNGPESQPVTVTVPQSAPPPGPPSGLAASVAGTGVAFTWNAPASGGPPTGYVLLAGTSPGFAVPIATMPMPASPRSFHVGGVPPGTYYARVVATNGSGPSAASNEVSISIAAPSAPGAPVLNPPLVSGHTVTLSWTPGAGGVPAGYRLSASATPGGPPLVVAPVSGTTVSFGNVPTGTYYVRIVAVNAVGTGPASNEVTAVVP